MTVYVDRAENRLGYMKMCHIADTEEELHAMANRIGLRREWFQNHGTPHYDVSKAKRQEALRVGAVEIGRRELVGLIRLTPEQEELIRFEYFNGTSARVETCRGALVGYFIQDMRAALDPGKQRPPDYQLAVANDKEVSRWLFPG